LQTDAELGELPMTVERGYPPLESARFNAYRKRAAPFEL
jgi:hypothetical protein